MECRAERPPPPVNQSIALDRSASRATSLAEREQLTPTSELLSPASCAEKWAREHLKEGFSLQEAAAALATSPRSLQRRCEAVLGKSPLSYFQDLRVERAQNLIHGSSLDVDAIAAEVGYVDGATLRTLLRQRLGKGVRDLRADLR